MFFFKAGNALGHLLVSFCSTLHHISVPFSFFLFSGAFLSLRVGKISECSYCGLTGDHCCSALVLFSFYERILFFCKFVALGNLRTVETGMNKECKKTKHVLQAHQA